MLNVIPNFKGIVHPKVTTLSSYTHPHVVPNLYDFLSSVKYKIRCFAECVLLFPIDFNDVDKNNMEVNGDQKLFDFQHSSKYLLLCSPEERNS